MAFASYRNVVNFYFSSTALSSSLLNCLYIYYLVLTLRSKGLSENNCRAIYYLQTSCTVVLAYTITAMHANFVLCLLSSPSSSKSSDSTRTCLQSCGVCLRRFFRRFCFCLVLCVWSLSFTATIPLLYTLDSNEKTPKPVYCPGTTQVSYLEEWFDHNRFIQSVMFHLIPLLATLFMSTIALLKLFYDCLFYMYLRLKTSRCCPCRKKSLYQGGEQQQQHHHLYQNQQQQNLSIPNSISMLSSLGIINNSNTNPTGFHSIPMVESSTPTSEATISSSDFVVQSCGHWCSGSFLRFLLVLSCCLLACIYPIAMRFYLVYFSVLVPLIFAVLNFSLGQLTPTQTPTNLPTTVATNLITPSPIPIEQHPQQQQPADFGSRTSTYMKSNNINQEKLLRRNSSSKTQHHYSNEEFELQSPLMSNESQDNDGIDEREEFLITPCSSSQSSAIQIHTDTVIHQQSRPVLSGKQKYFSNNLYEKCSRNMLLR